MTISSGKVAIVAAAVLVAPAAAAPAQRPTDTIGAGTAAGQVQTGAQAWTAGNYARAIGIWRPLATAGDPDAQYDLAQAYRLGRGVTADQKVAQDWYARAAAQGHPQAQANYGLLLFQGGSRKEALPWLNKAADRGDARAQYVVGTALFNGDIAAKDWVRAYALMTRASASGLPPAIASLAQMDKYIPAAQRTQGIAMARDLERNARLAQANDANLVRAQPAAPRPTPPAPAATVVATAAIAPAKVIANMPPPAPALAAPAPVAPVIGGDWRVQVGAYGDPAAASRMWDSISGKTPGLGLHSYLVKAGPVTRLQAGPLATRADASKACARIKAASGSDCFPVAAQ